ncbi:MAG: hypothetical protein K6C14_00545 [Eubacterium sp.]|nr:hypothetical protein [Eubacterium sp.]
MNIKNIIALGTTATAVIGAGIYGGLKIAKGVEWFKNYSKLIPYTVQSVKDSNLTNDDDYVLTAHRGFRAVAPEDTLPAYEEAGKAGYWGAECDTYRTRDGVWIVHHDPVTTRMMDKSRVIELSSYDELLGLTYTNGHNIDKYPYLRICTLEDFFKTCAKYGMTCTVELKYNRNRAHYQEIIDLQKKYGVEASYIAFSFEDLVDFRKITDAPLYYLVEDITDEAIEKAKSLENCGISYNCNDERNTDNDCANIKKAHAAGVTTATWTCDSLELMEKLVRAGTRYITTNCITY